VVCVCVCVKVGEGVVAGTVAVQRQGVVGVKGRWAECAGRRVARACAQQVAKCHATRRRPNHESQNVREENGEAGPVSR